MKSYAVVCAYNGYHFDSEISQTGWYAKITNYRSSGDIDVTEYRVGHIYN